VPYSRLSVILQNCGRTNEKVTQTHAFGRNYWELIERYVEGFKRDERLYVLLDYVAKSIQEKSNSGSIVPSRLMIVLGEVAPKPETGRLRLYQFQCLAATRIVFESGIQKSKCSRSQYSHTVTHRLRNLPIQIKAKVYPFYGQNTAGMCRK